jgi:hypothetical protein
MPTVKKAKTVAKKAAPAKKQAKPLTPWQAWCARPDALDDLCSRIEGGETLTGIAKSVGGSIAMLSRWIAAEADRSARAREARIAAAASYEERALDEITSAADPFELAKAKELAHHLRWKASKADPGRYGDKLDLKQELTVQTLSDDQVHAELAKIRSRLSSLTGGDSGASSPGA